MLVLDPQIRQDLNKLEAVVFAPHNPGDNFGDIVQVRFLVKI
jgi:hypothetical protein